MTPQQAKQLGEYLRATREQKGLSARETAEQSGLTKTTVLRIERGEFHEPSAHKLAAFADALGLPLADLYARAGYLAPTQLPTLTPYLRAKYGDLPDEAVRKMTDYFGRLAAEYGYDPDGPAPGADETNYAVGAQGNTSAVQPQGVEGGRQHMETKTNTGTPNLLPALRALSKPEPLTPYEANFIAELQANRLLEHLLAQQHSTLEAGLSRLLPSIRVVHDPNLPVSGSAHWNGQQWLIALSSTDDVYRRRSTLLHLLKRVIDHGRPPLVVPASHSPAVAAEHLADYFAACVLMPEALVVAAYKAGLPIADLARRFTVPEGVMADRLEELQQIRGRELDVDRQPSDDLLRDEVE